MRCSPASTAEPALVVDGKDVTGFDVRTLGGDVYQQFINYPSITVMTTSLAAAVQGNRAPKSRSRVQEATKTPEARAVFEPHAAATVRRPAARTAIAARW